jgi:hypothetical protein
VIVVKGHQLGDALLALPAVDALCALYDEPVSLIMQNREVAAIADLPPNCRDLFVGPALFGPYRNDDVWLLDMHAALLGIGGDWKPDTYPSLHPTQVLMRYAGLDVPDEVPQPRITVPDLDVPSYDFLIAPRAHLAPERSLSYEFAAELSQRLQEIMGTVAFVGGYNDPRVDNLVDHHYGKPLPYVVNLLRKCRGAVITCDSGVSRLCHAAGIDNHILLASTVVPLEWATHPKAHVYYTEPNGWKIERILDLTKKDCPCSSI